MFAIAIVDNIEGTLTLARDTFGIKPLYIRELPGERVAFASEPRALAGIAPRAQINQSSIASFLHLGAISGDESPFKDIDAVPANTYLTIDRSGARQSSVNLDTLGTFENDNSQVSGIGSSFLQSVDLHLNADVPTALLLSAGFDSAAIAASARKLDRDLHCVTVAGSQFADESEGADRTARHYRQSHVVVPAEVTENTVDGFFRSMQRPTIDGLNTFIVCQAVKAAGYKVALSGVGGDEILGGYSHFALLRYLPILRHLDARPMSAVVRRLATIMRSSIRGNSKRERLITGKVTSPWQLALLQRELFDVETVRALAGREPLVGLPAHHSTKSHHGGDFVDLVDAEFQLYLQRTLLPDADAFSMTHSLELRVPYVHVPFISRARELALHKKKSVSKQRLAEALEDSYLLGLTREQKKGFSLPMDEWIATGPLSSLVTDCQSSSSPLWEVLDRKAGLPILRQPSSRWSEAWALVALNKWIESTETLS
jgi:asparagine synthase (glutamine-hydrolysing)